jgi:hypothetical protein
MTVKMKVVDIIKTLKPPDDSDLTTEQAADILSLIDKLAPDYPEDGTKGFIAYNQGEKRMKIKIGRFLTSKLKFNQYFSDEAIRKMSEQIGLKMFGCNVFLVKGKEITEHYRKATGGNSCMTGEAADYTLLYEMNPDRFQLAFVSLGNDSARAIVSKLDNGEFLMDRQYCTCESLATVLRDYAVNQGWYYKNGHIYKNGEAVNYDNPIFAVSGLKYEDGYIPYMDTLRHANIANGKLNIFISGSYEYCLENTGGFPLGGGRYCENCGNEAGGEAVHTDGGLLCEDCYNERYFYCEHCGEDRLVDDGSYYYERMGYYICESCYEEDFFTCETCGKNTQERQRQGI